VQEIDYRPHVPVTRETDVLVIGGGPAGIGAAVGVAKTGAKVLLVERYGFLGGNATASLVGPFTTSFSVVRRRRDRQVDRLVLDERQVRGIGIVNADQIIPVKRLHARTCLENRCIVAAERPYEGARSSPNPNRRERRSSEGGGAASLVPQNGQWRIGQ
jgi:ribulose 1,5-bisphosphate synthetase/thiazole synthase